MLPDVHTVDLPTYNPNSGTVSMSKYWYETYLVAVCTHLLCDHQSSPTACWGLLPMLQSHCLGWAAVVPPATQLHDPGEKIDGAVASALQVDEMNSTA